MKGTNLNGAARIKEICEDLHTSVRQLALSVGLSPHNFYDIFSGRCGLSEYTAMKINKALPDYSIEWLLDREHSSTSDDANNDSSTRWIIEDSPSFDDTVNDSPKELKVEKRPYAKMRNAVYPDVKDQYIRWLQKQLEKERDENKRLLNIILNQDKQHSYENLYIDTD